MNRRVKIAGVMVGDIQHKPDMRAKYGAFFDALARRFEVVEVFDANLDGVPRYWNALQTFSPSLPRWKEHFFKNVSAFKMRSRRATAHLRHVERRMDVVLQLGALLDPTAAGVPVVVYTDNTTRITARTPACGRLAFGPSELERWLVCEQRLYQRAFQIGVRSQLVRSSLLGEYGVPEEQVHVVGGGVNLPHVPRPAVRSQDLPPRALFVGKDFHRKGGDLVLQAFSQVRQQIHDAELWLVTGEKVPAGLPLEGVRLLPPLWSREAFLDLYRRADLLILPSRHETWGDVLLEAMAFGLPCIGVTGQAMEEIIRPGLTGLLVPPEQVAPLADAMLLLFNQSERRLQMGRAAWETVHGEFTWDSVVERLAPILEQAAQSAARATV